MKIPAPAIAGGPAEAGCDRSPGDRMPSLICYCLRVDKQTVLAAIESGCSTVEALSAKLRVCTGCGGCRTDLEDLLAFNRSESDSPKNPSAP